MHRAFSVITVPLPPSHCKSPTIEDMNIPSKYHSRETEEKWYHYWLENGYFNSKPDGRPSYTIVIPPPNVTGVLHMGHMLNNTIQDILIRRARMRGYNACWVPGTDHASIATEAKVVAHLKARGISKSTLSRDEFLEHAWAWTHKHGGIILEQLKKLGASCDWTRIRFTMDKALCESVTQVFVDLYDRGLIYRDYRMVNWDPQAQTTLSDEEVNHVAHQGTLYYLRYPIKDSEAFVTVATTRPETILGDTALCVHPQDERYAQLRGKTAVVPLANREIPIIQDDYVDREFGTGCLKITPAHDANDYAIGRRHQLDSIDLLNADGTLNQHGLHYQGRDRFEVRQQIAEELRAKGFLLEAVAHDHKVGTSERTGAVIEPRLSAQWFLSMKDLAKPALEAVLSQRVKLLPEKFVNTYRHWMENVHDWNISRQLWWGHQLPVYYYGPGATDFVVANTPEGALAKARKKSGRVSLTIAELKRDPDVLDTWFSSWIWPISVFDGIRRPDNEEIDYYYPTQDLVTAPEILFFWVARMIAAGYAFRGEKPFSHVYLTGIVRDKQGRKMSKSLGNSPDPIALIERYGADGVRVGMLLTAPAGNDLPFDEALCLQGRNLANKLWNAFRLVKGWKAEEKAQPHYAMLGIEWFENRFHQVLHELEGHFATYRISDALMLLYKLIRDDFCGFYLEIIKPPYGTQIDIETLRQTQVLFEGLLKVLHPFMPFITEEIWQSFAQRSRGEALIITQLPKPKAYDETLIGHFEFTAEVISALRHLRKQKNIPNKQKLSVSVLEKESHRHFDPVLLKLAGLESLRYTAEKSALALSLRVGLNEYLVPVEQGIDAAEEITKAEADIAYLQGFLKRIDQKLQNEWFIAKAPKKVVAMERKKQADAQAKIKALQAHIETLRQQQGRCTY